MKLKRTFYLVLGPAVFLLLELLGKPESMNMQAFHVLAVTFWIAIWWVTEAIPIAVTALLPIILFPLLGAVGLEETSASYAHKYVFLYLGGFMIAIAIEKWNLHKRIALTIISWIGTDIKFIILGFMLSTAFLSMWISNTATSVMMLPIGMALVSQFKNEVGKDHADVESFSKGLMLAIAYSASIGGFATLIGTPPNLVLAGVLEETYGVQISFTKWLSYGLPLSACLLVICWIYLTRKAFSFQLKGLPGGRAKIRNILAELGKTAFEERLILIVFVLTATAWISRSLIQQYIPSIDDTIIAMISGFALFILPSKSKGSRLLDWDDCKELPWGIILLFGGGLALAKGFSSTGLAEWIASQLTTMEGLSLIILILVLVTAVNFLTELTSNLATTAMLLPILAPMALAFDVHPFMIMVSVTVAASCAFMLPVATPPNAVVFGSGYLRIPDMMRAGIWMNLISIVLITCLTYLILPLIWGVEPDGFPDFMILNTK